MKTIKILVSLSIMIILIYRVDILALFKHISQIKPIFYIIAFVVLIIQSSLSSLKWRVILSAEKKYVPFSFLLKSYLISSFISLFLPSSFGGDMYRIYSLKKYNKDYIQNTSSVLFDRMSGLFALLSISIISFALFFGGTFDIWILVLYIIGIIIFWLFTTGFILRILEKYNYRIIQVPRKILVSFSNYRNSLTVISISLVIAFVFQSNVVLLNKFYANILNIDVDLTYLFVIIPIVYLSEALPISINGIGVREGTLVFFLKQSGITEEQGLALGLLSICIRYVFVIFLGGSLFILEMIGKKEKGIRITTGK